jgi:hypothetical protein
VDQCIAGRAESLKERTIGIEVFGRQPYYDTSTDAIVRVTASDVRKRLKQHYDRRGAISGYQIELPSGSYVPQISWHGTPASLTKAKIESERHDGGLTLGATSSAPTKTRWHWAITVAILTVLNALAWFVTWNHVRGPHQIAVLPWSTFWSSSRPLLVVTSDPNIAEIQGFTGGQITLSDYANRNYIPHPEKLDPDQLHFCRDVLRGDKASTVDTPIVANVAQMAQIASKKVTVRGARTLQLADLEMDSNYILLGSPRSNPWVNIYNDRLDFRFEFDPKTGREVIHNVHPRPAEPASYVATAAGWQTGQSYAIIAFVKNPDQGGDALVLAGENGEGTKAAGKFVSDLPALKRGLASCGVPQAANQHFEILLRLNTLAGSPSNVDTLACHTF